MGVSHRIHQIAFPQGCRCDDSRPHHCEAGYPGGRYRRVAGAQPNQARSHCRGGGKLVGIVSRANILQALSSATRKLPSLMTADDSELRRKVVSQMASEPWRPTMLTVTVQDRTVDLWGVVHSVEQKKAAQLAAETTPGVRAVVNNIFVQPIGSGWSFPVSAEQLPRAAW